MMIDLTIHAKEWKREDESFFQKAFEKINFISHQVLLPANEKVDSAAFEKDWDSNLKNCDAVSFDIFDTALLRTCLQPSHVFLFLKNFEPFKSLSLNIGQIYLRRIRAEQAARNTLWNTEQSVETTLSEIYTQFCESDNLSYPLSFVEAEKQAELSLAVVNQPIFKLYLQARDAGKKILFISDTFFDRAFLKKLLCQCDYSAEENDIFPSCEYRKGKYERELFYIACKEHHIDLRKLLHIGDNIKSDIDGARNANCKALLHPFAFSNTIRPLAGDYALQKTESLIQGIAHTKNLDSSSDQWFQFGHYFLGPFLTGFTLWLIQRLKEDSVDKAFFLLRDGFLLYQFYEIFRSDNSPSAHLLHSSRRSFGVAALGCDLLKDIEFLIVSSNPRPAKEFLTRLDIDSSKFEKIFIECGFESSDEIVDHLGKPDKVLALLRHPVILTALNQRALVEKKLLLRYLEQCSFFENNKVALVDVGWNCSIQKFLSAILAQENKNIDLGAYYLGTLPRAQDGEHCFYQSYCCHNGDPHYMASMIRACCELFEISCSNFEGSLRHFTKADGKVVPVLDPVETSKEQLEIIQSIHNGALAFANTYKNNPLSESFVPYGIASAPLYRLLKHPTPDEAKLIGSLNIGDGLGSQTKKPLAAFSDNSSMHIQKLLFEYQNAYWKQGLLAQNCPQAWLLRNLLMDDI